MVAPFHTLGTKLAEWFSPPAEAAQRDDAYMLTLEVPGVAREDIEIAFHDGVVTIKGEKRTQREEKTDTYFFSERAYGAFSRSFRLPADATPESVRADLKDGVLTVTAAKAKPEAGTPTAIKINVD